MDREDSVGLARRKKDPLIRNLTSKCGNYLRWKFDEKELSKGRLSPADLSERLNKKTPSIVRSLAKMMVYDWVVRVGTGKRAYYSLTAREEASIRRRERP